MKKLLIFLMMVYSLVVYAGDLFPDDYGDDIEESTIIFSNGSNYNGRIEIDTDKDWFKFVALPDIVYSVEIRTNTIWDIDFEFRGKDKNHLISKLSSVNFTDKIKLIWTNTGAAGPYYIGVNGYLLFTTGTYMVVVTPLNMVDVDHDGLPDGWELSKFGSLTNNANGDFDHDGFSNIDEFYSKTSPINNGSFLLLRPYILTKNVATVYWNATPDAAYRLFKSIDVKKWNSLVVVYNPTNGGTNLYWDDKIDCIQQFYRIEIFLDL